MLKTLPWNHINDRALTAVQRAEARFGGHKKPNAPSIEIEKTTTLQGINDTFTGIYDTLRYMVSSPIQHA